jgi:hypothetical protein
MKPLFHVLLVLAALGLASPPIPAVADQNPPVGTVIDNSNLDKYQEFFGPAMQWVIKRGVKVRVGALSSRAASEKRARSHREVLGQVELSPDGTHTINYVAGLPFPKIDPNDPQVAVKLMYNFEAAIETDDLDLRNFDCDTGALGKDGGSVRVEKHFLIDHFRRMYFTGRLEVDPKPAYTPNRDQVRYKEALYPLLEPFDLKGRRLHVQSLPRPDAPG